MIKIYVQYYEERGGKPVLILRKVIKDRRDIIFILKHLLLYGQIPAVITLYDPMFGRRKIEEILRRLEGK